MRISLEHPSTEQTRLTGEELSLEPSSFDIVLTLGRSPGTQLCRLGRLGHSDIRSLVARDNSLNISHDEASEGHIDVSTGQPGFSSKGKQGSSRCEEETQVGNDTVHGERLGCQALFGTDRCWVILPLDEKTC